MSGPIATCPITGKDCEQDCGLGRPCQLAASAPSIRKLDWRGDGERLWASAFGIEIFYRVYGKPGSWSLISLCGREVVETPGYETQKAAQNAAQVDFERRVKAEIA